MAKKTNLQIWAEYIPAWLLLKGLGKLPRKASVTIGIALARLFYFITGGRKSVALTNLAIAFPEKPIDQQLKILKASFDNLGRTLAEFSQFSKATPDQLDDLIEFSFESDENRELEMLQYADAEAAKGRGTIVVGPHLGNWEIGVLAYSATRHPIQFLARPLDNPKIEDMVAAIRSRFGNRPVNKTNSVGAAMEVLSAGGVLGALPDVNMHPKDGVFVPFFGKLACTTRGLAMLAMRANAMIVPMCCIWDPEKEKYIVHFARSIIETRPSEDRNAEILRMTAEITLAMENFIRMAPDQWLWTHKRWKTRPAGEAPIY